MKLFSIDCKVDFHENGDMGISPHSDKDISKCITFGVQHADDEYILCTSVPQGHLVRSIDQCLHMIETEFYPKPIAKKTLFEIEREKIIADELALAEARTSEEIRKEQQIIWQHIDDDTEYVQLNSADRNSFDESDADKLHKQKKYIKQQEVSDNFDEYKTFYRQMHNWLDCTPTIPKNKLSKQTKETQEKRKRQALLQQHMHNCKELKRVLSSWSNKAHFQFF